MTSPFKYHADSMLTYQKVYDTAQTFVWCKREYKCAAGSELSGHDLEFGGQLASGVRSITVARSQFGVGAIPTHGESLTLTTRAGAKPIKYRITDVSESTGGELLRINLVLPESK